MRNNIQAQHMLITFRCPGTNWFKTVDYYNDRDMQGLTNPEYVALMHTLETSVYPCLTGGKGRLFAVQVVNKCARWN